MVYSEVVCILACHHLNLKGHQEVAEVKVHFRVTEGQRSQGSLRGQRVQIEVRGLECIQIEVRGLECIQTEVRGLECIQTEVRGLGYFSLLHHLQSYVCT